ncbi:hypothetical protein CFN79_02640 [Chromobacterium vaccinii]|nr:hypothetical protein CFN79_02640 [Chromobacterium vaccinii]
MIRATPLTRWVCSDFEDWRFGAIAGHARSLLDGFLLFNYLMQPIQSDAELKARINVMHVNDCTRRIKLFRNIGVTEEVEGLEKQLAELQDRLLGNEYFNSLSPQVQKNCKNGQFLTIDTREEMLAKVGFEKGQFDALYDLWSQHIHILPLSFYRIEPNGRGTGIENSVDRAYMFQALEICSGVLTQATELVVQQFPDVASARKGVKSTFSPGPAENKPRPAKPSKQGEVMAIKQTSISEVIKNLFGN